jgi:hypothetical protein
VKRVALNIVGIAVGSTALTLLPAFARSAEPPALDEEFLEYLSEYEGPAENWTWFADDGTAKDPAKNQAKEDRPAAPAQPVKEVKK